MNNKSPYLEHNRRLADIITAIQVMATFPKYASRDLKKWEKRLGKPVSASTWDDIISDHPEFFRKRTENDEDDNGEIVKVSLNWRWSFDKNYSPDLGRCLSEEEIKSWRQPNENRFRLTKQPLSSEQTEILINTAISLHNSAISNEAHRKWWVHIVVPAITALIGAALGFYGAILKPDSFAPIKEESHIRIQQIEKQPNESLQQTR